MLNKHRPNLIIINGPPGAGKSSVAEGLHKSLEPLSFLLSFDVLRCFFKDYRNNSYIESTKLTYELAMSMIEVCLKNGKDVIFERYIVDEKILKKLQLIGKKYHANMHEFILWADKATIIERTKGRADRPDSILTSRKVEDLWKTMNRFKAYYPKAVVINVKKNDIDQVLAIVKKEVGVS